MTSNCCDAKIIMGDICSDCKEHCQDVEELEEDKRNVGVCGNCGLEFYNFEFRGGSGLCQDCYEMELTGEEYGIN